MLGQHFHSPSAAFQSLLLYAHDKLLFTSSLRLRFLGALGTHPALHISGKMVPYGLFSVVQDTTWVNNQESHAPKQLLDRQQSGKCRCSNKHSVVFTTVQMLPQIHFNVLSLTFQASTYLLGCWPLCHKSWLEILFSLKVSLKWINSSEKFQFRELISCWIPSKFFTKALIKATALCFLAQWLLLIQNHIHGLEKSSCKSRSSQRLRREERDQELCISVIVVSHGNSRHQAWLFLVVCYGFWSLTWPVNPLITYNWVILLYMFKCQEKAAWTHSPVAVSVYSC